MFPLQNLARKELRTLDLQLQIPPLCVLFCQNDQVTMTDSMGIPPMCWKDV